MASSRAWRLSRRLTLLVLLREAFQCSAVSLSEPILSPARQPSFCCSLSCRSASQKIFPLAALLFRGRDLHRSGVHSFCSLPRQVPAWNCVRLALSGSLLAFRRAVVGRGAFFLAAWAAPSARIWTLGFASLGLLRPVRLAALLLVRQQLSVSHSWGADTARLATGARSRNGTSSPLQAGFPQYMVSGSCPWHPDARSLVTGGPLRWAPG